MNANETAAEPTCYVLDSFALLAFLQGEAAKETIKAILEQAGAEIYLSVINLSEVLYLFERERGADQARLVLGVIQQLPLRIVEIDLQTAIAACHIKASYPMSLADSFGAALAIEKGACLVTGDPEFHKVEKLIEVQWLPAEKD
jgi:ribonuclease VapC